MCVAGTAGDNCNEVVSKCHSNCNNNGKCIDLSDQKYKCVCEDSYTGEFCETRVEPCYPNPCFNEGICLVKNTKEFQCVCKNGYNGQTCEVRIKAIYSFAASKSITFSTSIFLHHNWCVKMLKHVTVFDSLMLSDKYLSASIHYATFDPHTK